MKSLTRVAVSMTAVALGGCAITRTVSPVDTREITLLCVKENRETFMVEFEKEMIRQIEAKGVRTRTYSAAAPAECRHRLEYSANWHWDLAMYMNYANIRIWEGDRMLGQAIYDSRAGGLNLNKFGPTAEKLRGLLDDLLPGTRGAKT